MTYDVAIISAVTFVISMFCLERNHMPSFMKSLSMIKLVPICLLTILIGMGLSILTHLLYFVVVVSIMCACLIFWRYQQHMSSWDKKHAKEKHRV